MASGSECSTDFEASVSVVSVVAYVAASEEEQYDNDDFDNYSDSFESDNDTINPEVSDSVASDLPLLSVGARVQIFWREENEWFDGVIQSVEEGNEPRYYVHYDDGEHMWEGPASIRPLPALITDTAHYDQLQQLLPLSPQGARAMVGRSAIVYWPNEGEWYHGIVSAAQASPAALKIEYDDGDSRWEQEHVFKCILVLRATTEAPKMLVASTISPEVEFVSAPLSPPGRVLYARPYRQVVSDHFQPVRMARPYRCVVEKHSESVVIPRRPYSERRYLHEALECSRFDHHTSKSHSIAQTELPSCVTESS